MKVEDRPISELKMYENNPRNNDEAVAYVAKSISEFGFRVPILIDESDVIIAGHTRLKAARSLNLDTVPTIRITDLTDEQVRAFRLADNKVGEIAEWDFEKLEAELELISDFDMTDFGFADAQEDIDIEVEEVDVPDAPEEPQAKRGDIYRLGNHILMCGSSTEHSDVEKLLDGNLADMVLTDPPYNIAYVGAGGTSNEKKKRNKIKNDKMPAEEFEQFMLDVYGNIYTSLKEGGSWYTFYKELGNGVFITSSVAAGLTFKQELIWVKNQFVLGESKYQNMYEPCLFGCKGQSVDFWYAGRKERSVIEHIDLMDEFELRDALKELLSEQPTDIIREHKPLKNDLHPTMKPIKLLANFIKNSSKEGDIVLDLFAGSGSTLLACEQLGRRCFTMELDEKYVDVVIKRWEDYTGQKAELIS